MKKTIKLVLFGAVLAAPLAAWADPENLENDPAVPNWTEADGLTSNWFGTRTTLQDRGVEFFGGYTAEVWGNTNGGVKDGAVYTGLLDFGLELDLEKSIGWSGATVSTTWLWLSGLGIRHLGLRRHIYQRHLRLARFPVY